MKLKTSTDPWPQASAADNPHHRNGSKLPESATLAACIDSRHTELPSVWVQLNLDKIDCICS